MIITPWDDIPLKKPNPKDKVQHAMFPRESLFQAFVEKQWKLALQYIAEPFEVYHTWNSMKSAGGFPDLVCAHPLLRGTVYAELKTETGEVTEKQARWLHVLSANPSNLVYLWRPSDTQEMMDTIQLCVTAIREKQMEGS